MSSKEYFHNYYLAHKEAHIAKSKVYYEKNRENIMAQRRVTKSWLSPERKAYSREWARLHPLTKERKLQSHFRKKYKFSLDEFNRLVEKQNNLCALCRQPEVNKPRLSVDHDHRTAKVRGLLCHNCNVGLGHFQDSIDLLEAAKNYLLNGVKLEYVNASSF